MATTRYIHNISGEEKTYRGVPIADGAFYEIKLANLNWYRTSDAVMADLASGDLRMSNDGVTDYSTSAADNISFLLGTEVITQSTPAGITEPNNYRARMVGMGSITVAAGTTVDLDHQMTQLAYQGVNKKSYFDGVQYYAKDAEVGDYVQFQVVDVDNVLGYGAGFVVEEFGDTWYVGPDALEDIRLFKSAYVAGLYIRVKYTSTGTSAVKFMCNMFRFIKTDEDA